MAGWRRLLPYRSCRREVSQRHDASGGEAHSEGKVEPPNEYLAYPTDLGGKTYLNVVLDPKQVERLDAKGWQTGVVESYTFVKYQLNGDKLVIWLIDEKAKQQAITSGKIKGVVEKNRPAKFTDATENMPVSSPAPVTACGTPRSRGGLSGLTGRRSGDGGPSLSRTGLRTY